MRAWKTRAEELIIDRPSQMDPGLINISNNNNYYDSEDVWMPYGSLSSQPGASNVTQAALKLTTQYVQYVHNI